MARIAKILLLALATSVAVPARAYFQGPHVDTTFGEAGTAAIAVPSRFHVYSMRTDRTGRLLVLYTAALAANGGPSAYYVARLRHDGTSDTGFGAGGKVDITRMGGLSSRQEFRASLVTIDRQGRVLVAGQYMDHDARGESPLILGRLNANGAIDTTFGAQGVAIVTLPQAEGETACKGYVHPVGVAERPDGKLLLHGSRAWQNSFGFSEARCMFVASFHADGRIDTTFGAGGIAEAALSGHAYLLAGRLHDDGRFEGTGLTGGGAFGPLPNSAYATWIVDAAGRTTSSKVVPRTPAEFAQVYAPSPGTYMEIEPASRNMTFANVFTLKVRDANGTLDTLAGNRGTFQGEISGASGHRFAALTPDGGAVAVGVTTELGPGSSMLTRHHLCVWRSDGRFERCGPIGPVHGSSSTSYLAPDGSLYVSNNDHVTMADGTRAGLIGRFSVSAPIVEYYNSLRKHYFMTWDGVEAAWIDRGGAGAGWARTGQSFRAGGIAPSCRFYGTPGIGPASHFFTVNPAECEWVKQDPGWTFEGMAFHAHPEVQGKCPANLRPIHRYYNNRAAERESNHRYVKDLSVAGDLPAQGWTYDGVVFCVRP